LLVQNCNSSIKSVLRMRVSIHRVSALATALVALSVGSCGSSQLTPTLHPAKGSVLVDAAPAEGASVVLHASEGGGGLMPSGTVQADGTFTLSTYPHGEGAPAGEYRVLLTWYPKNAREIENPQNKLPEIYADADNTPLPKVTIKEGPNELEPFKISSKGPKIKVKKKAKESSKRSK
jgi:hypothetical protein